MEMEFGLCMDAVPPLDPRPVVAQMTSNFTNRRVWVGLLAATAAGLFSLAAGAGFHSTAFAEPATPEQSELSPRDLHVWGRFAVGTWKKVRVITEAIDSHGAVTDTTTTETKTTLVRVDSKRLTLRIEATVEVAGKRFESQTQTVEYGYYGETPSERPDAKNLGNTQVTIEGRDVPCQLRLVVASSVQQKQVMRLYLSDDVEPFVLKRETTTVQNAKSSADQQTTAETEVIAVDMPYAVMRDLKSAAYEQTVQKTQRGTNVSLDVICVDVPGGIVARTSKEFDTQGHLLRRNTVQLVDYSVVVDDNDEGSKFLTRRQARRARRH
jgi:hypothetical protein